MMRECWPIIMIINQSRMSLPVFANTISFIYHVVALNVMFDSLLPVNLLVRSNPFRSYAAYL